MKRDERNDADYEFDYDEIVEMRSGYTPEQVNSPYFEIQGKQLDFKPNRCQECEARTGYLYERKVDSFGRTLWLCGARHNDCKSWVQDF